MLELLYIARFDYLANPYMTARNSALDPHAVAIVTAEADRRVRKPVEMSEFVFKKRAPARRSAE